MHGLYQGQIILNVFHYNNVSGAPYVNGDAELSNLITKFHDRVWDPPIIDGIRDFMSTGYMLQYITAQQVHPARQYYNYIPYNEAGLVAGDGVPSDTNLTVSFRTARALRGSTGNKKFTGMALTTLNGNAWTNAIIASFDSLQGQFMAALFDVALAPSWNPTVWSPQRPLDRTTLVGTIARDQVRVLRRRQLRLGI